MDIILSFFQQHLEASGLPWINHAWFRFIVVVLFFAFLALIINILVRGLVKFFESVTSNQLDDKVFNIIRGPLFWVIVLTGSDVAFSQFKLPENTEQNLSAVLTSIIIILVAVCLFRLVKAVLISISKLGGKGRFVQPETLPLFQNLALVLIFVFATYFLFNAWNVDLTAWFASAGIAGVAIGFAAKDTLANLFSGVFIMADSPYKVGDTVVLDSGERGEITHIGLRSTRMFTTDHAEITIPNSIMGNTKVVNQSGGYHRKARIRAPIGVAYGSDIEQVREVLQNLAQDHADVCQMPEPRVRFRQFGASSLDFELLFWIENAQIKGRVLDNINTAIYQRFNELDIEIPFAKQDIYIKEMPKG